MKPWSREERCLAGGIAVALAAMALLAWRRHLDHDEVYHLHLAWHVAEGRLPYRDVIGTHHPLYWLLLSPLFRLFDQPLPVLLAGRAMAWLASCGVAWLTYRLGTTLLDRRHGLWAALLMAIHPMWQHAGVEMRADMPQTIAFLLALGAVAGAATGETRAGFRKAGVLLAVAFAFLQKAVVCYAAVAASLARSRWPMLRSAPVRVATEAAWLLAPLGGLLIGFDLLYRLSGSADAYWNLNWGANQGMWAPYPFPTEVFGDLMSAAPLLLPMAFVALFLGLPAAALDFAVVPGLFLCGLLFALKALHKQYYLPALPLLAIAQAAAHLAIMRRVEKPRPLYLTLFLLGAVAMPLRYGVALWPPRGFTEGHGALDKMILVHENTTLSDPVLDFHYEFNLMRPDLGHVWMGREELVALSRVLGRPVRPDLVEQLTHRRPRFASTSNLTEEERTFLEKHYVPAGPEGLAVAGCRVRSGDGRPHAFELLVPGEYLLERGGALTGVALDGRPWEGRGVLTAGKHAISWTGSTAQLVLRLRLKSDRTGQ